MTSQGETAADAMIGARVGHYRVVRRLGAGGMGVVYEAVHDVIGQRAALKIISGPEARRPDYYERFVHEARSAVAVRHRSVVQVFDFGRLPDEAPFLLMEYVEGYSLRSLLERSGALSASTASIIGREIAGALAAIHDAGVVHRDLKPENVLVVGEPSDGVVKVIDFGVARLVGSSRVTEPGLLVGTPMYMAPEQCTSEHEISGKADVYALGVILFEMICGRPPFVGSGAEILRMHVFRNVPRERLDGAPAAFADTVVSMMSKTPRERPSPLAVAASLCRPSEPPSCDPALRTTEWSLRPGVMELRTRTRRSLKWIVPTLLTVSILAIALGVTTLRRRARAPLTIHGMRHLRGGSFTMGRTPEEAERECAIVGDACRRDTLLREQPAHVVKVAPFHIDEEEATNEDLASWLSVTPVHVDEDADTGAKRYVRDLSTRALLVDLHEAFAGVTFVDSKFAARSGWARRPATQITWDAARMYCSWRGKRLPTEAEWEFAARGATARLYPWGEEPPTCDDAVLARDEGQRCARNPPGPVDVGEGRRDVTPDGVRGLCGNATEWVADAFVAPFYQDCESCEKPAMVPARESADDLRVVRGGSWVNEVLCFTSARGRWKRAAVASGIGVRCAADER